MNLAILIALLLPMQQQDAMTESRVVVYPATAEVEVGNSRRLTVVEEAYNVGAARLSDATVQWISTDSDVVTVSADGTVLAVAPGEARIAAIVDGKPGYASVTVPQLPPARMTIHVPDVPLRRGTSVPLEVDVQTRLGTSIDAPVAFTSSNPDVAAVNPLGRLFLHGVGTAEITGSSGGASASAPVTVVANDVASFEIDGPNEGVKAGDVIRYRVSGLTISGERAGGFMPAWSVSGSGAQIDDEGEDGVFVATRPGRYAVTAMVGTNTTRVTWVDVTPRSYNQELVKVGRGPIANHHSADTWVFEGVDGRDYAYVGTYLYDWAKVFDVTDPENPVLTDSIQVDARRINDVKIHPNNRLGIITREGASNRRNGIVFLDLSDPAHPTILSEYTDTVTGGVHNTWVLPGAELLYAVHNGTRDVHIIDISDPSRPAEVGRWGLDKEDKSLHDVIVQDGYAYLSYWNDGLVILDAGAGSHGGTPRTPTFVSQIKFDTPNAHTAWRYGRYVFVGDEIFPPDWDPDLPIEASGYIHIVDVQDINNPIEVGRYEVPEAGTHNVWAEDDKLYVGYYQGGLRVVDISGELRGDLYQQGREIARLKTTDEHTMVPNWPMTFGSQLFRGNIYTSDLNSGLWIAKLVETVLP